MNRLEWIVLIVSATYIIANIATMVTDSMDQPPARKHPSDPDRCTVEELD